MTRWIGLGLVIVLLTAGPAPSLAQEMEAALKDSYPTNLTMLGETTKAAISELLLGFHAPSDQTLLVEVMGNHEGNWFVENHLLAQLTAAGYQAYLKEASVPTPPSGRPGTPEPEDSGRRRPGTPEPEAGPDTTESSEAASLADLLGESGAPGEADTLAPADTLAEPETPAGNQEISDELEPEAESGSEPETDTPRPEYVLRFRVVQFEITYPDNFKTSPLGSRKVQRLAAVNVIAHLLRGEREDVVWVGSGDVERIDTVPASKLPLLEGPNFPFTQPTLQTSGLGSLVEPVLVTGIVAGLIYLFYTNQN